MPFFSLASLQEGSSRALHISTAAQVAEAGSHSHPAVPAQAPGALSLPQLVRSSSLGGGEGRRTAGVN